MFRPLRALRIFVEGLPPPSDTSHAWIEKARAADAPQTLLLKAEGDLLNSLAGRAPSDFSSDYYRFPPDDSFGAVNFAASLPMLPGFAFFPTNPMIGETLTPELMTMLAKEAGEDNRAFAAVRAFYDGPLNPDEQEATAMRTTPEFAAPP